MASPPASVIMHWSCAVGRPAQSIGLSVAATGTRLPSGSPVSSAMPASATSAPKMSRPSVETGIFMPPAASFSSMAIGTSLPRATPLRSET